MTAGSPDDSINVQVLYSIPSPYQENLFERVGRRQGIDLHVYYCNERPADRDWEIDLGAYGHETLPGVSVRGQYLNPTVVSKIAATRPDVLIVGGYSHPTMQLGIVTGRTLDIPIVLWNESHGRDWRNSDPDLQTKIKDQLLSALSRQCSAFLVPGGLQKQYLVAHGAPPESVFSGTHTCNVQEFYDEARRSDPKSTREEYGVTEDIVLTFVGRLIEEKGLAELVDAAAAVSAKRDDVGFVIAGNGSFKERLRERVEDYGLENVYFPGFVRRDQLPALYGASDVFVFPSRGDPWGVVVNEAMACGLPVITTDSVGAGFDLVNDGINGAIVPSDDADALADAIDEVLASDYDAMGLRSAQIIDKWTHEHAAQSILKSVDYSLGRIGMVGSSSERD